ncbi:MAG: hypothetical protein ACKO9I_19450 [Sphaerospermopsis kisseleviana]|uniref:DUF5678 domain-containing protein n=2 Tax=Sphaerospermopsis TaxID=752201 RepID=A0A480A1C8_9CYAN|nr:MULTISPECIES: hypothetical protein [Sphaerospermopsis]MBD2146614.1 hypothetical protein [Sphaerospermopsis sp. FACHB-1194]MDB9443301.1 hypothetical protein [Sphaerospermopsis kisseleviana CS-549]BAZ82308.1 hypothetical protein NIES73_35840 [Sphaerospermopsis kisseleviana NIES-73]GCL38810.1 hypothetical protein SR1949_39290 [Sphaerospermopsis reniformis]
MTQLTPKPPRRRGRIFPELTFSPEELARRKAENEAEHQLYRAIFEKLRPELIKDHYGWYIAIELNSGDYVIDQDKEVAHKKAREKFTNTDHCVFCLNESGAVGRI